MPRDQAEIARDRLGGATEVAAGLPDQTGTLLLDTAREAFTQGFQVAAITGVVMRVSEAAFVPLPDRVDQT